MIGHAQTVNTRPFFSPTWPGYEVSYVATGNWRGKNFSDPIQFIAKKFCYRRIFRTESYRSSIGAVSDQYAHIYIRPVWIACLRGCSDTELQNWYSYDYSLVSDPLPKSSVAFLDADLDQIGSSESKCTFQIGQFVYCEIWRTLAPCG